MTKWLMLKPCMKRAAKKAALFVAKTTVAEFIKQAIKKWFEDNF